jgi:Flp pilus assembly protein TadD
MIEEIAMNMKSTHCIMQHGSKSTGHDNARLRKAASLGLAAIVSTLFTACANDPALSGAAMPEIKPIFVTRSADTPDAYYALGKYYFWQDRYGQAQQAFEQALKLQPDNIDVLNGLGAVYDRLGQFEDAQRSYRLALRKNPEAGYIWANLGYSMLLQGRAVTAVALLDKAVTLDPENAMARRHLALATAAASKLAAAPDAGQQLPVVAATSAPPAAAQTPSKPSILALESQPAAPSIIAPSIIAIVPHDSIRQSDVVQTVVPVRKAIPVAVQARQPATVVARHDVRLPTPTAPTAVVAQMVPATLEVPIAVKKPAFSQARIEISNGNGVNGMARALRTAMKPQGVNVTRVTNARPFNKRYTVILCASEQREAAQALSRLLPGNPAIAIRSTAKRNVELRVVLGADAALAWNNSKKVKIAALAQ